QQASETPDGTSDQRMVIRALRGWILHRHSCLPGLGVGDSQSRAARNTLLIVVVVVPSPQVTAVATRTQTGPDISGPRDDGPLAQQQNYETPFPEHTCQN